RMRWQALRLPRPPIRLMSWRTFRSTRTMSSSSTSIGQQANAKISALDELFSATLTGMSKLPPLIELRAFDAAARHLSFKKAAAELGVTPTAISHQIRLLEQYCGRALFRRRPRPLSLTEAGTRLFPVIRDGLEAFATAIAAVKREAD